MSAPTVRLARRDVRELVKLLQLVADLCVNSNAVITTNLQFMVADYDAWDLRVDARRLADRLARSVAATTGRAS